MPPFFPYAREAQGPAYPRWNRLSDYFYHHFGERVRKIPLDAGFTCPNRDGAISSQGCIFCNDQGSGTGLGQQGLSLAEQWEARCAPLRQKGTRLFMAYLQSFSNTYGPIAKLASALDEIKALPGLAGLSIGTRPDCVDDAKLALIARTADELGLSERWIEFGVQSSSDATLERIRRGHGIAAAERAINAAHAAGLKVCVHLIAALPGEGKEELRQSVRWASAMPIDGIKFHCLYVCKGTELERLYAAGAYEPPSREEYVDMLVSTLPLLRPDVVVQRLNGDPAPGELAAPAWAADSRTTLNTIAAELIKRDTWQGKDIIPLPGQGL